MLRAAKGEHGGVFNVLIDNGLQVSQNFLQDGLG